MSKASHYNFLVSLSLFGLQYSFAIYPYVLQLKHFSLLSLLKLSFVFSISINTSFPPYIISASIMQFCQLSIDSYLCLTEVIAIFHSLNVSSAAISGYPNIVFIMSILIFFFNNKIVCMSLVSASIANALNLIMKFVMCFLLYLNILIFHSASATLLLSLNIVLISLTNSF